MGRDNKVVVRRFALIGDLDQEPLVLARNDLVDIVNEDTQASGRRGGRSSMVRAPCPHGRRQAESILACRRAESLAACQQAELVAACQRGTNGGVPAGGIMAACRGEALMAACRQHRRRWRRCNDRVFVRWRSRGWPRTAGRRDGRDAGIGHQACDMVGGGFHMEAKSSRPGNVERKGNVSLEPRGDIVQTTYGGSFDLGWFSNPSL